MTLQLIWQFFKQQLELLRQLTYPETVIVALFTISTLYIGPNKVFLLALLILFFFLYLRTKSFYKTAWFAFLGTLLSISGRHFPQFVLYGSEWVGGYELFFTNSLLFNDVLLLILIYYILTRKSVIEKTRKYFSTQPSFFFILILFLCVAFFSTLGSSFPSVSLYYFIQIAKMLLLFFVSIVAFVDIDLRKKSQQILLWLVMFNSFFIIAQQIHGGPLGFVSEDHSSTYGWYADENPGLYRPGGLFTDPNLAATLISCALPFLFISLYSKKDSTHRPIVLIIILILCLALLFTASRSAWIISLILFLLITRIFYQPELILQFVKKYVVLILIPVVIFGPIVADRLITLFGALGETGGGMYRLQHLMVGIHYMSAELFGIGPGVFMYRMAIDFPFSETGLRPALPHNILAQIGAELGIIGLVLFLMFCTIVIVNQYRNWRTTHSEEVLAGLLTFIVFLALTQLFPWFINSRTASWFWIISAIGVSSLVVVRNEK